MRGSTAGEGCSGVRWIQPNFSIERTSETLRDFQAGALSCHVSPFGYGVKPSIVRKTTRTKRHLECSCEVLRALRVSRNFQ